MSKLIKIALLTAILVAIPFKALYAKTLTIAVIDSGIDAAIPKLCKFGHKSFVASRPNPLQDEHGHGTHIAGLISAYAGKGDYCVVSIKYWDPNASGQENLANMVKSVEYATNIGVNFINISGGGPEFNESEFVAIRRAIGQHIKIVVAAGNERSNLDKECNYYPACYDERIVMVGNLQKIDKDYVVLGSFWRTLTTVNESTSTERRDTERSPGSNYGKRVTRWEIGTDVESTLPDGKRGTMTGTSQATAIATGKLVRESLQK